MNSTTNYVVFHQNLHVKMVQMHKHDKNIYHIPLRDRPFKKKHVDLQKGQFKLHVRPTHVYLTMSMLISAVNELCVTFALSGILLTCVLYDQFVVLSTGHWSILSYLVQINLNYYSYDPLYS